MQQTSTKEVKDQARLGKIGDSLGIVQKNEFWPYYEMLYAQTRSRPRE